MSLSLRFGDTVLAIASVTLLALQLRRGKRTVERIFRQPGLGACAIASSLLVVGFTLFLITLVVHRGLPSSIAAYVVFLPVVTETIGPAIAGAWLALGLGKAWMWERDWIERCCRVVAGAWILLFALTVYHDLNNEAEIHIDKPPAPAFPFDPPPPPPPLEPSVPNGHQ